MENLPDILSHKREGCRSRIGSPDQCHNDSTNTHHMPVVLIEKPSPHISVLTLNRPERRNALSIQLLTELIAAIKVASDELDERVLVLRGAGAAFCTGLDLKE